MVMTTTSIYVDGDLLKTAKDLNVNMSKLFTKALEIEIGLPMQKQALEEELLRHKTQVSMIEARIEQLAEETQKQVKENSTKNLDKYISQLKQYKKRVMEKTLRPEVFNKMVTQVAKEFNKDISEIMDKIDEAGFETTFSHEDGLLNE